MKYEGPIKCTILKNDTNQLVESLEYQDHSQVSKNEFPYSEQSHVDIGSTPWPYKIPASENPITWTMLNYTPDIPDRYWQMRCFAAVYRTMGLLIPRKYQSTSSPNAYFRTLFTDDLEIFGGRKNVIAQKYLPHPQNSREFNGLGQWNDNFFFTPFGDTMPAHMVDPEHYTEGERWSDGALKTLSTIPLLHVGMHEDGGHGHGYKHDEKEQKSILYPYANVGYKLPRFWTLKNGKFEGTPGIINEDAFIWHSRDIERFQEEDPAYGYGKRNILSQTLNNMRARRIRGRFVDNVLYRVVI